MIRYRKSIEIKTTRNDELHLETDIGQSWRTFEIYDSNAFTEWMYTSAKGDLQTWQKDIAKVVLDALNNHITSTKSVILYKVYQKGRGYKDSSGDVFIMRIPNCDLWFISTTEHTWIFQESLENFYIKVENAEESVLNKEMRQRIYDWSDGLRGITPRQAQYTEADYIAKGIADA